MRGEMVATAMTSRHSNALCTRAGFINNVTIWKTKSNTNRQDPVSCGPPIPRNYTWTCKLGCFFTQQVATKSPYPLQYIIEMLSFYWPNSISCSVKGCSKLMFPEQSLASYKDCDSHAGWVVFSFNKIFKTPASSQTLWHVLLSWTWVMGLLEYPHNSLFICRLTLKFKIQHFPEKRRDGSKDVMLWG